MNTNVDTKNFNDQADTHQITSTVAFLAGIEKRIFENEHEPLDLSIFNDLSTNKSARIIRNLCRIRTKFEQNFCQINSRIRYEMKSLTSLVDLIPQDAIAELDEDGINIIKANQKTNQYIIDINKLIRTGQGSSARAKVMSSPPGR